MANYYLYCCYGCSNTLYGDNLPDGEEYTSTIFGELCSMCQEHQNLKVDAEDYDDYD